MAWRRWSTLAATAALTAGALGPVRVQAQADERSLTIFNIHTKETVTAVFKRNGRYVETGVEKLDQVMRDHRRNEATKMDRRLFDLLWEIHDELGSKAPIHLVSGYRSGATNAMLRRTVGGQAKQSRHILGKAADVHFPDVPLKQLRYSAIVRERGGVGYYPTSALPFVHVDTDRVRSWPRLPRHELALLFPSGATQHAPASGGPITREDVRIAKADHAALAQQIATFHGHRRSGHARTTVADSGATNAGSRQPQRVAALPPRIEPAAPSLLERPQLADRPGPIPASLRASISSGDRERIDNLLKLAAAIPRLVSGPAPAHRPETPRLQSLTGNSLPAPPAAAGTPRADKEHLVASIGPAPMPLDTLTDAGRFDWAGWISAPAYDDEHPEELSYRPFPIAPYLTESPDQTVMGELVAHDVTRTLEMLDQLDAPEAVALRPADGAVASISAQRFTGTAIKLDAMHPADPAAQHALEDQTVLTSRH